MDKQAIDKFLKKYTANLHTELEHEDFLEWLRTASADEVDRVLEQSCHYYAQLPPDVASADPRLVAAIENRLNEADAEAASLSRFANRNLWLRVAAVALLVMSAGIFFYRNYYHHQSPNQQPQYAKIVPGTNKAYLTLANGRRIILNSSANGLLAREGNLSIIKLKDGELKYTQTSPGNQAGAFDVLTTPRGGQYKVTLPDGTMVWLNAASSLKIPLGFAKTERKVELSGEGYFEVAKNKAKPFKVAVNRVQVQVYGTHFNISAYPDETSINTTLVEGSVKVSNTTGSRMIVPGQQAIVSKDVKDLIKVEKVDAQQIIEWKNGNFSFSHERMGSIMRKISRWYDVEVVYKGKQTNDGFVGALPRSSDITDVLNMLELTNMVHFKIEGRRVTVMR